MRGLLSIVVLVVVVIVGLRMAGIQVPLLDYPVGGFGIDAPGPAMPDIQIEPPGFGDFEAP